MGKSKKIIVSSSLVILALFAAFIVLYYSEDNGIITGLVIGDSGDDIVQDITDGEIEILEEEIGEINGSIIEVLNKSIVVENRGERSSSGGSSVGSERYSLRNVREGLDLFFDDRRVDSGETFGARTRFGLYARGVEVSSFELDFSGDIDLSDVIADVDLNRRKSFMHSSSGRLENINLIIPRSASQDMVRICSNASSFDEIFKGCSSLPTITSEYVLRVGDPNIEISADGMFFIVSGITGTGGQGEGSDADWWDSDWVYRDRVNISVNDNLSSGYTIEFNMDTRSLVSDDKVLVNGSDLRIVYWNGSANREIDRVNNSEFNLSSTGILFRLQAGLDQTTDNQSYYVYYGNLVPGEVKDNKSNVVYFWEDFEDQVHEFSNGPLLPSVNTGSKRNGVYGLEGDGAGGYRRAVRPDDLERGVQIEGWVYSGYAGDNADLPGIAFGMQLSGDQRNGYQVVLDWRSGGGGSSDMQIRENYNSGAPLDTSAENTVVADSWYYMKIYWKDNGDINATIYDSDMDYHGSLFANDGTYSSGYYGVSAYRDGFWDDYSLRLFVDNAPGINMVGEEILGPTILDESVNSSVVGRNEYVLISSNITSENGIAAAWVSVSLPNTTVQNYTMTNSSEIYSLEYQSVGVGIYSVVIYSNDSTGSISEAGPVFWTSYGLVELKSGDLSPSNINQGESVLISCRVRDIDLDEGVEGYTVSYYGNTSGLLGTNLTNSSGWATLRFTSYDLGSEKIICNITSDLVKSYNVTNDASFDDILEVREALQLLIVEVEIDKNSLGIGGLINITAEVTSPYSIDALFVNMTNPLNVSRLIKMSYLSGDWYRLGFDDTWKVGNYTFYVIANDSSGDVENSSDEVDTFGVSAPLTISIDTNRNTYGLGQNVSLSASTFNWWDEDWGHRRKLTINNNDASVLREKYSVSFDFNVGSLITQGNLRNDCNDLRIIYFDGVENIEIDRVNESICSGISEFWFALQDNITGSGSDGSYYVYYGNSGAGEASQNRSEVYLVWDDFESYTLGLVPGGGWVNDAEVALNDWQVKSDSGNKVVQDMSSVGAYRRLYNGEDWWDDYRIEAKVKLDSFLFTGITFRRQPWSGTYYDHYAMITDDRATSQMSLRRWTGGGSSFSVLSTDSTDFVGLDTWHNYSVEILGNNIGMSRDGVEYINEDISGDATRYVIGGQVGLMSHAGLTMFDDIKVRLIVGTEPSVLFSEEEVGAVDSTIVNTGSLDSYGYLMMRIEKNNSGTWQHVETLVNDTAFSNKRTIGNVSFMDLTSLWEGAGNWNTSDTGVFRAIVELVGLDGVELYNDTGALLLVSSIFDVEALGPEIMIGSPMDNSGRNDGSLVVSFNATDDSGIESCSLVVDGDVETISWGVSSGINIELSANLPSSRDYDWKISCSDSNGNEGESMSRRITLIEGDQYFGRTTDLSQVDIENITNLIIEKPDYGLINFTESVNLLGGVNINSYVNISNNFIEIDSENIPQLNKSARLTLYNLALDNPIILKNGESCLDCNVLDYSGNNLTFSVDSFSNYSAVENSELEIWDDTETNRSVVGNVSFYANYTNRTSGQIISGASCLIDFDFDSGVMSYDVGSGLFEYNRSLDIGVNQYNVTCFAAGYATIELSDYSNIEAVRVPNGAQIEVISSERGGVDDAASQDADAGNITSVDVYGRSITQSWQGYFGNVSGVIELKSGASDVFYDWSSTSPTGEVYATRAQDVNFATVGCANVATISNEEIYIGQSASDRDSITNTFNQNNHPEFYVGISQIGANSCDSINIYDANGIQSNSFYEVLLSDGASNMIYASILENDLSGFDSRSHDFEMIVGENGHGGDTGSTPYYFYLEVS